MEKSHKSPINRNIMLGCAGLIIVLSLLLAFQTRRSISDALYTQYETRLRDVVNAVERSADADDLRECIRNATPIRPDDWYAMTGEERAAILRETSTPKRDELQRLVNRFVDDFEMAYLYICIPVDTPDGGMFNVVTSTSQAEIEAALESGDLTEDWPVLYDESDDYTREQVQVYLDAWASEPGTISYFEDEWIEGICYTACKPLVTSDGETIAVIGADFFIDDVHETIRNYVVRDVILIAASCVLFGLMLALWLRKNVTAPIRALEQSALRFARLTREARDADELKFDADAVEAGSEVKLLADAMVELSQEMKDQVKDAATAEKRAAEMEEENIRLTEKANAALKIAELTQSVTSLLTNMPGLTSSKDTRNGKYLACNQAFAEFAGKRDPEDVIGLTDDDIFDKATAKRFADDDKKALSMDQPYVFYENVSDAMGNPRQFQSTKLKFTDTTGRLCTLCMRLDYTELTRARQETVEAKEAYEKAQSASAMYSHIALTLSANYSMLYYVNLDTEEYVEYHSGSEGGEAASEKRGENFFAAVQHNAREQVYPDDLDMFLAAFTRENVLRTVDEKGAFTLTYRLMQDSGEPFYVSMRATRMQDDESSIIIGVNLEEPDVRSELTGLCTQTTFSVRGKELLREHPEGWCLIALDLEHFKLFNEWYGREAGDQLLAQIGARLANLEAWTGALACYLGNDDFCVMMPYDESAVRGLFRDIHVMIVERGTSVGFMPAFGVCMLDAENTLEEFYDRASIASKHAKENYHTRIRLFEQSMYQKTEHDYQVLSDFQKALKERELFIVLQPQCQVATGRVVGAESLVRWKKADGSFVSPGVFVPVLEQYGFVTDLDKYVWEEVCRWQRQWIDGGHTPLPVSVNVSQIDIFTIDVPEYFEKLIKKYSLPVDVIKIEITESAYVGDGSVADTVTRLREKGFLVLMDDFGSGYSSLNMLRSLNVDIIKLDAQFLRMDSEDRKGVHILESIVNMAKTMGVPIIVEGVETQEETDFISSLGCRYVQGYFFYRPMPVADFEALIADPEKIDTGGFVFRAKEEFHTREFLDENIYSDTMLNNILGPVAFFDLRGRELDCVRYNEQFFNEVDSPYFDELLKSMQNLVTEDDRPTLYELLKQAESDQLGGAAGTLRLRRRDGTLTSFHVRFFFLEESENGKRFYGSVHNVSTLSAAPIFE